MSLYHYTNLNARNSIVLNKELWLSKSSGDYLEPFMKINNGIRSYHYDKNKHEHLLKYFEIFYNKIIYTLQKCLNNCYYISFRNDRLDDYPMFQNFCKIGGMCIEFYKDDIIEFFENQHGCYHTVFHDFVSYEKTTPFMNMFNTLDLIYKDDKLKYQMDNDIEIKTEHLINIVKHLMFIKHESFINENEYRFVIWRNDIRDNFKEPNFHLPVKIEFQQKSILTEYLEPYQE